MSSLALYRRYRPESFAEVIGQEHVTAPLQQALRNNRVNHAYLFSGPRGCGKTTSARILARCLNCEQGPTPTPCGECQSCQDLARNGRGSIDVIEIDAASHGGVDDARELREKAFFGPASSRYKIYIIDEAHMVTSAGFNALLKVVEEPPEHLKFIFATTEPEKVIGTIRSRTHHYPFRLVPPGTLREYLGEVCEQEKIPVEDGVLPLVVRAGAGSVRDSMSVMDQLLAGAAEDGVTYAMATSLLGYTDGSLLDAVVDAFAAGDGAAAFEVVDRVIEGGNDPRRFVADLLERLRDLVILAAVPDAAEKGLIDAPVDVVERMQAQASVFGGGELSRAADLVNEGLTEMRGATSPRLQLELICARVLLPAAFDDERSVRARLERLERGAATAAAAFTPAPPGTAVGYVPGPDAHVPAPAHAPAPAAGLSGPAAARAAVTGGGAPASAPAPAADAPAAQGPGQGQSQGPAAAGSPAAASGGQAGAWPTSAAPGAPAASAPQPQAPAAPGAQPGAWPTAAQAQAPAPAASAPQAGAWPTAAQTPASTSAPQAGAWPSSAAPAAPAAAAAPAAPTGGPVGAPQGDAGQARQLWPNILEAVKNRRRFTWILLSQNAQVAGCDGITLQVGFSNAGARDSFANSGSEDVLRQALGDLGLQWKTELIVDPSGGANPPGGGYSGGGGYGGAPAAPQAPAYARPQAAAAAQAPAPAAPPQPAAPAAQATPAPSAPAPASPSGPAQRYGGAAEPEAPPVAPEDDIPAEDDPDLDDTALTGHDLIVRELGATVIEEIANE
ncbi:DNA polymerase III subunit gamma and tau [Streptomyces luteoverticillatus]|uniref:DNA polymerase III subunit gamma/tau n=1 Tax=Streptomyces luteoverticillatus TaxID=66425 RepID=A0A3S9PK12_STRLT|nr:DNA polymerase III subunit gamma and tau [Streptomyces luteoverticillatus]AZQ72685.1 DNA polymerase III subunit gamma and tau [Streptomyces luteoverticillatus]